MAVAGGRQRGRRGAEVPQRRWPSKASASTHRGAEVVVVVVPADEPQLFGTTGKYLVPNASALREGLRDRCEARIAQEGQHLSQTSPTPVPCAPAALHHPPSVVCSNWSAAESGRNDGIVVVRRRRALAGALGDPDSERRSTQRASIDRVRHEHEAVALEDSIILVSPLCLNKVRLLIKVVLLLDHTNESSNQTTPRSTDRVQAESGLSQSALFVVAELKSIFKVLLSGSDIEQQLSQACVKALLGFLLFASQSILNVCRYRNACSSGSRLIPGRRSFRSRSRSCARAHYYASTAIMIHVEQPGSNKEIESHLPCVGDGCASRRCSSRARSSSFCRVIGSAAAAAAALAQPPPARPAFAPDGVRPSGSGKQSRRSHRSRALRPRRRCRRRCWTASGTLVRASS